MMRLSDQLNLSQNNKKKSYKKEEDGQSKKTFSIRGF